MVRTQYGDEAIYGEAGRKLGGEAGAENPGIENPGDGGGDEATDPGEDDGAGEGEGTPREGGTGPKPGDDYTGAEAVSNGRWVNCFGPGYYNGYQNAIGAEFGAALSSFRAASAPVELKNFRVYRTVKGATESELLWATEADRMIDDRTQWKFLFHDRGEAFFNLPADSSPMQVYLRPAYAGELLGKKSDTITIFPNAADPSQSYCMR